MFIITIKKPNNCHEVSMTIREENITNKKYLFYLMKRGFKAFDKNKDIFIMTPDREVKEFDTIKN